MIFNFDCHVTSVVESGGDSVGRTRIYWLILLVSQSVNFIKLSRLHTDLESYRKSSKVRN